MLEIGSVIDDKYRVLSKIGQGGMSVVYLAMNERANKPWAIKEVRKDGVDNYEVIKQGQIAETNLLKKMRHTNLPSIVDVIDKDDSFLIVMDYIEGKTLSDILDEGGAQPYKDVIEWSKQLCDVLGYLHNRKPAIIYRDMKPSNIMLKPDGNVVLIDFGTAREFKEKNIADTTCLGTQGYAAPEQFGGMGQTDPRTDIYCLGATMYHLVTGHNPSLPPYEMYPIRRWNPALSSGLESIIIKCTQRNPDDRYQSCAELMYALEHYEQEDEVYKKKQNNKWIIFLASAIMTLIFGIASLLCFFGMKSETEGTYTQYLNEAETEIDESTKYEYWQEAIKLNDTKYDAYGAMLTQFKRDGVLSAKENEIFTKIWNEHNENLIKNPDAYYEVSYEVGLLYFYYYENSEDQTSARKYLNIASQAQNVNSIDDVKISRAKRLYTIADYSDTLHITDKAGDAQTTYRQYWDDLTAAVNDDIANSDNTITALVMYKFMVFQIANYADDYKRAGVTKDEIEQEYNYIAEQLSKLQIEESDEYQMELFRLTQDSLSSAKNKINSAYQEVEGTTPDNQDSNTQDSNVQDSKQNDTKETDTNTPVNDTEDDKGKSKDKSKDD